MTSQSFNRPGAVDLSSLANTSAEGTNYVTECDQASLEKLMQKSTQHPVILELYSPRDENGKQLSVDLKELANSAAGKYLVARVNVDEQPKIAQAFGVQAVPTVIALIAGQLAPLFQGTKPKAEVSAYLDQVMQLAVANGIVGRAEPVKSADDSVQNDAESDSRFDAADDALAKGEYAKAVTEFDKILESTPNDAAAIAGRAQASLLKRSLDFNPEEITNKAENEINNVSAQLNMADLEVINGSYQQAFDRLIRLIVNADKEEKETIRLRLLELFEIVGRAEPIVLSARRKLMSALF